MLENIILRCLALMNRWLNLFQDRFVITTRQRIKTKWEANYGSKQCSSYVKLCNNSLPGIDPNALKLWRLMYYLYLIILAGRCLTFAYVAQTNHIRIDAYQRLDPLLVMTIDYFAGHHSVVICIVLLVALFLHLDYRTNVRLLPKSLARPIHELMIENCDQFWHVNERLFDSSKAMTVNQNPVRQRQSIVQKMDNLSKLWRSAYETRFASRRLSCFPHLSARTRARATVIVTIVDKLEAMVSLSIIGLFCVLMLSHAGFIISGLNPNPNREIAWTWLQMVLICGEVAVLNFTYLHSMSQAAFIVESAGLWLVVATFHLLECITRLRILRRRTGPDHSSQMKLIVNIAHFRSEHTAISMQLAEFNRRLISPALSWASFAFVPITIYMIAALYLLEPPPLARLIYCVGLVLLIGSYFLMVSAPMLYMMDVMYRPAKLLSSLQACMGGRFVTPHKLKLATYHELINTRNRKPVCFTMGAISPLTQWWCLEFILLFTSMMMFAFKMFSKTQQHV